MTIYSGKLDVLAETIVNLLGSHEISEANVKKLKQHEYHP